MMSRDRAPFVDFVDLQEEATGCLEELLSIVDDMLYLTPRGSVDEKSVKIYAKRIGYAINAINLKPAMQRVIKHQRDSHDLWIQKLEEIERQKKALWFPWDWDDDDDV